MNSARHRLLLLHGQKAGQKQWQQLAAAVATDSSCGSALLLCLLQGGCWLMLLLLLLHQGRSRGSQAAGRWAGTGHLSGSNDL